MAGGAVLTSTPTVTFWMLMVAQMSSGEVARTRAVLTPSGKLNRASRGADGVTRNSVEFSSLPRDGVTVTEHREPQDDKMTADRWEGKVISAAQFRSVRLPGHAMKREDWWEAENTPAC